MARNAENWLKKDDPGQISVSVIKTDSRDRAVVPSPARNQIEWLKEGNPCDVKLELSDFGRIIVGHLTDNDPLLIELDRLNRGIGDPENETAILAITERFLRSKMEKDARLQLRDREFAHLGIPRTKSRIEPAILYIVGFPNRFEIWTEEYRTRIRDELANYISDFITD